MYVGTAAGLEVYGLTPPANAVPSPPVLNATTLSGNSINLTWTDPTTLPNIAAGYLIEESTDDDNFTQITTAPAGATSLSIGGLTPLTTYYFRIRGYNSIGDSGYSNVASATTNNQIPSINFSNGFANSSGTLTYNGSAAISGSVARLTNGGRGEAGSVFTTSPLDVSTF